MKPFEDVPDCIDDAVVWIEGRWPDVTAFVDDDLLVAGPIEDPAERAIVVLNVSDDIYPELNDALSRIVTNEMCRTSITTYHLIFNPQETKQHHAGALEKVLKARVSIFIARRQEWQPIGIDQSPYLLPETRFALDLGAMELEFSKDVLLLQSFENASSWAWSSLVVSLASEQASANNELPLAA
jgi:hypothetical protein